MYSSTMKELTFRGMILGAFLTIIFTASNVYLGLKVGLTFASSIPAAVISMAVLKMFLNSNILENNLVQTQVSAAGTLSSVVFVMPALAMSGYWTSFPLMQTFILCLAGGGIGVLFTIPLRRAMVVESDLAYPEGVAAAEILKVGSDDDTDENKRGLKEILLGTLIAAIGNLLSAFGILKLTSSGAFVIKKAIFAFSFGSSFALLGAGYLIGLAGGIALLVGMILAWGVLTPYFTTMNFSDSVALLDQAESLWVSKVRFIGTGVIAVAALWTLVVLLPPVVRGMKTMLGYMKKNKQHTTDRTDTDLSPRAMILFFIVFAVALFLSFYTFTLDSHLSTAYVLFFALLGTFLCLLIGFLVAAACGYMAGLVGSSSSPISGVGLLAVIGVSLVILFISSLNNLFATPLFKEFAIALAIFTTSAVLAIAAISNDNLQDLKTGFLLGATPQKQQIALIIGCVIGAIAIAPVLNLLYQAYGFSGALPREGMDPSQALSAPQAMLMNSIATGIFNHNINYNYIVTGIILGIIVIVIDKVLKTINSNYSLPPLAVGIGIYLPSDINIPLVVGAFLAYFTRKYLFKKYQDMKEVKKHEKRGVLFASGLIVGESILGVIIAGITVFSISMNKGENPLKLVHENFTLTASVLGFLAFVALIVYFAKRMVKQ